MENFIFCAVEETDKGITNKNECKQINKEIETTPAWKASLPLTEVFGVLKIGCPSKFG